MQVSYEAVTAVRVNAICDCGGNFKPTGRATLVHPMTYSHDCSICGMEVQLKTQFPTIEYFNEAEIKALSGD